MGKTTGTDQQVLSLPKGGGAVQGLGATFETDLNTGTGSYSIPIDLPCGPNGIQPQINIRYHTAAGNGPFGLGWTLGLLAVARKTDRRIPKYQTGDEDFLLVGVDDLIPMGGGAYRPRVDTMNWRIRRQGAGWELTDTQGKRHRLGGTAQSRVETVADGFTKTALWLLEEIEDTNGNKVRYNYQQDGAQRYLESVRWGTYSLQFFYEDRTDWIRTGRYGFLLDTTLRCHRMELHVTHVTPDLVRSWTLGYTPAPGSGLSLLHQVTLCGHGADGSVTTAPVLTLGYSEFQPRRLERFSTADPGVMPGPFSQGRLEIIDWDGDGLPDLLELGAGQIRVWPNLGKGRFGYPRSQKRLPVPVSLDEPGVAFADLDGNGTADLIMVDRPLSGYYPHRPGGGFDPPVFWRRAPSVPLADRNSMLVDLDGDGITDLLVTGEHFFSLYYRDPVTGWAKQPHTIPRSQVPPVSLGDPRVRLADMNGDGLQDLVRIDGAGVVYWPYLGNGRWAGPVEMTHPPALPRQFDPRRLFLTDVDGDGCADLVYVDYDRVIYWLNQSGGSLSDPCEIKNTPPARVEQIRLADMKGTGTAGLLWSQDGSSGGRPGYLYLDFTGGVKPYLLTGIENGLGLELSIDYQPSTDFALEDAARGRPWATFHPFPLQCVAAVKVYDRITGQTSLARQHYHDGRFDDQTHTYLGFGVAEVETLGDDSVPALRTRNVYHIGLDPANPERALGSEERQRFGALRRRVLRTEIYGLDGTAFQDKPYQIVHHEYDLRRESGTGGQSVWIPYETRSYEEQWEREANPFAYREIAYLEFDAYGNIRRQRTRAWREGASTPDQDITTEVTFAINEEAYIVSLPARVTQRNAGGAIVSMTVTHYDGLPYQGLPEGEVTTGNVARRDTLAITDEVAGLLYAANPPDWEKLGYHRRPGESGWWVTPVSFNRQVTAAGITLITRGPRGFETTLQYDSTNQYPQRMTDPAGNVFLGLPDERVFQMASLRDPNNQEVTDRFDNLGRVVATIKPGDTAALPTSRFSYRTGVPPIQVIAAHLEKSGEPHTLDEYQYFNGRGELIQKIIPGEGDAARPFIMQESLEYTARGQVKARYLPYYVPSPDYQAPHADFPKLKLRYDALGRLLEEEKASGHKITQAFGPGLLTTLDEGDNAAVSPTPLIHRLDSLKRVLAVEHHLSGSHIIETQYQYDDLNRLIRTRDPDGGESRLTYDLLGRIILEETPNTGRTLFVLDAAGNQARRTTHSGKTVVNLFDKLDRLTEVRQEGGPAPEAQYVYLDQGAPNPPDGLLNRVGRLWQVQDRIGSMTYAYDSLGRISQTRRAVNTLGGQELVTDFLYDALGRQIQVTLPEPVPGDGRRVVSYQYNARGLLAGSPGYVRQAEYDIQGHLTRLVYQNNVENLLEFDSATGRPQRMLILGPDGTSLRDQTFTFDPVGNLQRIDSPQPLESGNFLFDECNRLTEASYGSGEHYAYRYSDGGNITWIEGIGALDYDGPVGSGAVTAAGGSAYTYDTDGNLLTAPYGNLQFDGLDNLTRVELPDGGAIDNVYDFQGRRALKQTTFGVEEIFADPHIEFHDGEPIIWILFGGKRIIALAKGKGVFLHADLLGTVTLYTGPDGKEVHRLAFGPYGALRYDSASAVLPCPVRLTGQPLDDEIGLFCLGRRFYDPRLGRFISPDRAVPGIYALDSWNRYLYAHNNPLCFTDPSGRFGLKEVLAIVGVAIVVAALVVAGVFTGGITWFGAISVSGLLYGTAMGVAAGAVIGGISAGISGGDIWAGILFGGFVGGVSAFLGGMLGGLSGGLIGSLFHSQFGFYLASGAVQGAIIGAGTGAAIGFAGGRGTAESIWTHIWKGAAIGAATGAILGFVTNYLVTTPNPTLRFATLENINPQVPAAGGAGEQVGFLDHAATLGQGVTRTASGLGGSAGLGTFIGFGSGPGSALVNIPLGWIPTFLGNYGGMVFMTDLMIGLDKFTTALDFDNVLIVLLELPGYFIGVFFTFADIGEWGWFEDMKSSFHDAFSMPEAT